MILGEIFGPDGLIILAVVLVVLLFGGSQLPKLARGLGSAKGEFENASKEFHAAAHEATAPTRAVPTPVVLPASPQPAHGVLADDPAADSVPHPAH